LIQRGCIPATQGTLRGRRTQHKATRAPNCQWPGAIPLLPSPFFYHASPPASPTPPPPPYTPAHSNSVFRLRLTPPRHLSSSPLVVAHLAPEWVSHCPPPPREGVRPFAW
jgi:hypothetical protein